MSSTATRTEGIIRAGEVYTVGEVARRLRLGRHSLAKLLAAVPPVPLGRRNRVLLGEDVIEHVRREREKMTEAEPAATAAGE